MIFVGHFSRFILLWACRLGDYVTLGGRVAIRDHVSIVSKVLCSQLFFSLLLCLLCAPCIKTRLNLVQHFVALSNVISWLHYSEHSWILLVLIQCCLQWRKLFFSSCWVAEPKKFICNLCLRIWRFQQIECSWQASAYHHSNFWWKLSWCQFLCCCCCSYYFCHLLAGSTGS